jgi:hypothetical protein
MWMWGLVFVLLAQMCQVAFWVCRMLWQHLVMPVAQLGWVLTRLVLELWVTRKKQ